jgi:hypothetical protein
MTRTSRNVTVGLIPTPRHGPFSDWVSASVRRGGHTIQSRQEHHGRHVDGSVAARAMEIPRKSRANRIRGMDVLIRS